MPEIASADRFETPELVEAGRAGDEIQEVDIGARLLELRRNRRMTLQDVSTLTGVSPSALSKIERNELSPTISTMQRIAQGLDIELAALLSSSQRPSPVRFAGRRSVSRAGEGTRHSTSTCNNMLLCADLKSKRATPIRTTVTARTVGDYAAWAKSDAEIFVMVLKGRMVVHSRLYEPLELGEGDSVYYDASTEHCWTSVGKDLAEVIWVIVEV
jgi:transcriptional regulator with XRE-family HTH domain